MKYCMTIIALLFTACHSVKHCPAPDAGTALDTPCAGKADGVACCLGTKPGSCHSGECVAK